GHARSGAAPRDAAVERRRALLGRRVRGALAHARPRGDAAEAGRRSPTARRRVPARERPAGGRRGRRGDALAAGGDDARLSPVALEGDALAVSYILDALKKAAEQRSGPPPEVPRLLAGAPVGGVVASLCGSAR